MAGKVISIINTKGGSFKTTTTLALGGEFALRGYRVLIAAVDAHNPGMMAYFLSDDDIEQLEVKRTSCYLFMEPSKSYKTALWEFPLNFDAMYPDGTPRYNINALRRATKERGWRPEQGVLHVIPDSYDLPDVIEDIQKNEGSLKSSSSTSLQATGRLRQALMPARNDYDFIFIDTPPVRPDRDYISKSALAASDYVILPLSVSDKLTFQACRKDVERVYNVSLMREAMGMPPLHILGIVVSKFIPDYKTHRRLVEFFRSAEDIAPYLFSVNLPVDNGLSDATLASELFQLHNPNSPVMECMPALVEEVLSRVSTYG